jgi:hypothetical protein
MTTKELTRRQARWAEILGCFDFEIIFQPGRQLSKPDALSRRPDLAPPKGEKLTFGQLLNPHNITAETFAEIAEFDACFTDKTIHSDNAELWFQINVVGVEHTEPGDYGTQNDTQIIKSIRQLTPDDSRLRNIIRNPERQPSHIQVRDGIVYNNGKI